jgi:putative chitinase
MSIRLDAFALRKIFPAAPAAVIAAFASDQGQAWLATAGISANRKRLAVAFAHCHAETAGFSIQNLTENINYTAARMAVVWPNRFKDAADVQRRYGTAAGWQRRAFDDIYGGRMGNIPGSSDGSHFIGRGGPQVTGRDGYWNVGQRCGLDLVGNPELACRPEHQPAILAGFWTWKDLSPLADKGGIDATVRPWNGGTNGLAERRAQFARIMPLLAGIEDAQSAVPVPPIAPPAPPADNDHRIGAQTPAAGLIAVLVRVLAAIFKRSES